MTRPTAAETDARARPLRLVFVSHSFPPPEAPEQSVGGMQRVAVDLAAALGRRPDVALDIDLELWLQLEAVRRGLPAQYRDPVVSDRIERFLSRAARHLSAPTGGVAHLQVRDVETGRTHDVRASQHAFRL